LLSGLLLGLTPGRVGPLAGLLRGFKLVQRSMGGSRIDPAAVNGQKGSPRLLCANLRRKLVITPSLGVRIGRRGNLRYRGDGVPAERPVDKRLLPPIRAPQDVVPDPTESEAKVKSRRRNMIEQRRRERAMHTIIFAGDGTGLGCIGNQGIRGRR